MVCADSLTLLSVFKPVVVAVAAAVSELSTRLRLGVVAVTLVVAFTGARDHGQQAGFFAPGVDAYFLAGRLVLEVVAVPDAFAAEPEPAKFNLFFQKVYTVMSSHVFYLLPT